MSLREARGVSPAPPRQRRHRNSHSADGRSRSNRDLSIEGRPQRREGTQRPRVDDAGRSRSDQMQPGDERRRHRRTDSRQHQVEHQASLRSLIGSEDMSDRDIDREIEEFARQIQEEGLLDGLDLDNIDLTRDDDLSRRITEAYRRRQRERPVRRNRNNGQNATSSHSETEQSDSRPSQGHDGHRPADTPRPRHQSRSSSATRQADDRSRPPPSLPMGREHRGASSRPRRRTGSGGRSGTLSITRTSSAEVSRATVSQTDLSVTNNSSNAVNDITLPPRTNFGEGRSSSTPTVGANPPPPTEKITTASQNQGSNAAFASRILQGNSNGPHPTQTPDLPAASRAAHHPADLAIVHSSVSHTAGHTTVATHQRTRSQLYPEPSISCSRCNKTHIEYDLHYNCAVCGGGEWNLCLDCYRRGKGCLYWFGFGYGAWNKWERARRQGDSSIRSPHMLTASRYLPPPTTPGGADGRKTLTTDDPKKRLQTGTFCARCYAWTNECFWRCDNCNDGDWGFCNDCVNQGKSCSHTLLPLTHEATRNDEQVGSAPRSPGRPPAATVLTGPQTSSIGPFKPLTFATRCDTCQEPIPSTETRYHCFSCTSSLISDASPGDYDICISCYGNLVQRGRITAENGLSGWRRCPNGHRMALIGFTDGKVGRWRYVDRDIVGGRALRSEPYQSNDHQDQELQKWSWRLADKKFERLVAKNADESAPSGQPESNFTREFPPDGGAGSKASSKWAWYPQTGVQDELLFPRGAEIREIEDCNGDWYFGTYMGSKGLFPAPYVQLAQVPRRAS